MSVSTNEGRNFKRERVKARSREEEKEIIIVSSRLIDMVENEEEEGYALSRSQRLYPDAWCRYMSIDLRLVTFVCAHTHVRVCLPLSRMTFARVGWCLSSYYKLMTAGEANADQACTRDKEGKSIEDRERAQENIARGKGRCSGVEPIIDEIASTSSINKRVSSLL